MNIMSTNFAKTLFGNMNMTSNCDVTNSEHQIQKTSICQWMNPPTMKYFCVRHWAGERDVLIKAGVKAFSNHIFAKSFHSSIWSSCTNTASPFTVTTRIVSCCIPSTAQMNIFIECKAARQSCVTLPTLIYLCPVHLQMQLSGAAFGHKLLVY